MGRCLDCAELIDIPSDHAPGCPGGPLRPLSRDGLLHELEALAKQYETAYNTDPMFHAKAKQIGNFLQQLESVHQAGAVLELHLRRIGLQIQFQCKSSA